MLDSKCLTNQKLINKLMLDIALFDKSEIKKKSVNSHESLKWYCYR